MCGCHGLNHFIWVHQGCTGLEPRQKKGKHQGGVLGNISGTPTVFCEEETSKKEDLVEMIVRKVQIGSIAEHQESGVSVWGGGRRKKKNERLLTLRH